ncbi:MAG: sialidase family protein, partial [Gammaproteobacteria bacterium]
LKIRSVTEEDSTHLRVIVENTSKWPDENTGIPFHTGGTFSFYYTTTDGSRVQLPISQALYSGGTDPVVSSGVADLLVDMPVQITEPGDSAISFVVDKPGVDVSQTEYSPLVVVYKGIIGQEEGIATSVFSSGGLMTFLNDDQATPDTFTPLLSEDLGEQWKTGASVSDEENPANGHSIFYLTYLGDQQLLGSGVDAAGLPIDYRSHDMGRTWTVTPDAAPMKAPDGEYYVTHNTKAFTGGGRLIKLNVSPGAVKTNGHYGDFTVYHSDDSGLSWTTGSAITGVYLPRGIIYLGRTGNTLAVPTAEGETQEQAYAFIGVYEDTGVGGFKIGVFRSDDGGMTWPRVNTVAFDGSVTRLDPADHEKVNYNLVYLGFDRLLINYVSYEGADYSNDFYISGDRGATWNPAGEVPAPTDRPSYTSNAPKVTSLVYLGNNKVYSQVALELFNQSFYVRYPRYPNYQAYLFEVTPGPGLSSGQPVMDSEYSLAYTEELIPVEGNTTNYYEKEIYHPFVYTSDNGVIPGLYE